MIFEGTTCKAEYDQDNQLVYFDLVGFANVEEYKTMLLKVLNFMKLHKVRSFVHNYRNARSTFANLNDWIVTEMKPAIDLGLENDVLIVNDEVFKSFSLRNIVRKAATLRLKMCRSRNEAEEWIKDVSE